MKSCLLLAGGLFLVACNDSSLAPIICAAGDVHCLEDGGVEVCSPNGTKWLKGSCAEGERCTSNRCGADVTDRCLPVQCNPGERRCAPADPAERLLPNLRIEACDTNGTGWCCIGSCANPANDGVCYLGGCVSTCNDGSKDYEGCEYFAVDLDNAYLPNSACGVDETTGQWIPCDAQGKQFSVVLSNPGEETLVYAVTTGPAPDATVEEQCGPQPHVMAADTLPPGGIQIVDLPPGNLPSERRNVDGTEKAMLAYRVASNVPMTVYQFNPLQNEQVFSNDASLLLPANTAGTKYYVMTREQTFNELKSYVTVVGISDDPATVTVKVTGRTLGGPGIPFMLAGQQFTTTLSRFEVLNIETNELAADLTGSLVTSDKPVMVFGGSEASNVPNTSRCNLNTYTCEWDPTVSCLCTQADGPGCNPHAKCFDFVTCCADHLEEQIFPVSTWGQEYVGVRSMPRGLELDAWRVMAAEDGTTVSVVPPVIPNRTLNAGEYFEFETNEDFLMTADKPISLAQFMASEQAPDPNPPLVNHMDGDAGTGDPSMMMAVPTRQFLGEYVFLAPADITEQKFYANHYVSIAACADASVFLDAEEVAFMDPLVSQLQINDIDGTDCDPDPGVVSPWRAYRVRIAAGFHKLTCPTKCSVMVHGYDQYVSYGYPGGLNLED